MKNMWIEEPGRSRSPRLHRARSGPAGPYCATMPSPRRRSPRTRRCRPLCARPPRADLVADVEVVAVVGQPERRAGQVEQRDHLGGCSADGRERPRTARSTMPPGCWLPITGYRRSADSAARPYCAPRRAAASSPSCRPPTAPRTSSGPTSSTTPHLTVRLGEIEQDCEHPWVDPSRSDVAVARGERDSLVGQNLGRQLRARLRHHGLDGIRADGGHVAGEGALLLVQGRRAGSLSFVTRCRGGPARRGRCRPAENRPSSSIDLRRRPVSWVLTSAGESRRREPSSRTTRRRRTGLRQRSAATGSGWKRGIWVGEIAPDSASHRANGLLASPSEGGKARPPSIE